MDCSKSDDIEFRDVVLESPAACRQRKKSEFNNDVNDNECETYELVEKSSSAPTAVEESNYSVRGTLASVWAAVPSVPVVQSLEYAKEVPKLVSTIWNCTPSPSYENVSRVVQGTMSLPGTLKSWIPGSLQHPKDPTDGDCVASESSQQLGKSKVVKVENKKQS